MLLTSITSATTCFVLVVHEVLILPKPTNFRGTGRSANPRNLNMLRELFCATSLVLATGKYSKLASDFVGNAQIQRVLGVARFNSISMQKNQSGNINIDSSEYRCSKRGAAVNLRE